MKPSNRKPKRVEKHLVKKECMRCNLSKTVNEFYYNNYRYSSYCKGCYNKGKTKVESVIK